MFTVHILLLGGVALSSLFRSTEAAFHSSPALVPPRVASVRRETSYRRVPAFPLAVASSSTALYYQNDRTISAAVDENLLRNVPFFVGTRMDDANRTDEMNVMIHQEIEDFTNVVEQQISDVVQAPIISRPAYPQRMTVFEGHPFFSLSNIEYHVAPQQIRDAASTGAILAAWVLLAPSFSNDPFFSFSSSSSPSMVASVLLAAPLVTAYLSITRSTIGDLTRVVSASFMNLVRLVYLLGEQVVAAPINENPLEIVTHNDDPDNPSSFDKSIPTLCGELVWYSARAVMQRAQHSLRNTEQSMSRAVDHVLQQQVDRTRRERLQRQERRQRALLQAQLQYSKNQTPKRLLPLSLKANEPTARSRDISTEPLFYLGEEERSSFPQNDRLAAIAQTKEAVQRSLLQRQLELTARSRAITPPVILPSEKQAIFYLGEEERDVAPLFAPNVLQEPASLRNDRLVVIARTKEAVQRSLLQRQLELTARSRAITPQVILPSEKQHIFYLGEEERDVAPLFAPNVLQEPASLRNDRLVVIARTKEAVQRSLLQRQLELTARSRAMAPQITLPSEIQPIFSLGEGEDERNVEHVFLLGDEERDMESISSYLSTEMEEIPEVLATEAGDFLPPSSIHVFLLGEDERDLIRMENASLTEPLLEEFLEDNVMEGAPRDISLVPSEVVQHVFLLGDEERDAVKMHHESLTAPFLLGKANSDFAAGSVVTEASNVVQNQPVFLLGDEEREATMAVSDPILSLAPVSVISEPTSIEHQVLDNMVVNFIEDINKTAKLEKEKRAIAEARRLIQERAIELGKKRLTEVLSGVRWKKTKVDELKKQNSLPANELEKKKIIVKHSKKIDICCESLARRSSRIQQFIARNRRYGTLFSDQSLVERGALYLLAATTPVLLSCWIQQAATEFALVDSDAGN